MSGSFETRATVHSVLCMVTNVRFSNFCKTLLTIEVSTFIMNPDLLGPVNACRFTSLSWGTLRTGKGVEARGFSSSCVSGSWKHSSNRIHSALSVTNIRLRYKGLPSFAISCMQLPELIKVPIKDLQLLRKLKN